MRVNPGHNVNRVIILVFYGSNTFRKSKTILLQYLFYNIHSLYLYTALLTIIGKGASRKIRPASLRLKTHYFTFALIKSTTLVVGVPGVNTSAMPAAFSPAISASGITPPPITRTSFMPFSFNSSTTFGNKVL